MIYYAAIIISMFIWGSVGIFTRLVAQPSEVIVFFRVLSACLCLLPFALNRQKVTGKVKLRENYKILILSGIFLSLNWLFFFKAVQSTTIAKATLSYYTAPVIVTILSPILLKEKLEIKTIISTIMAFLGIILIVIFPTSDIISGRNIGIIFGLCAAFFYSLVTITGKKLSNIGPINLVFYQTLISAIVFFPFVYGKLNVGLRSLIIMCIIGVLHTAVTLTLYFFGINKIKVQYAGVLSYIDPLSAVFFGLVFFKEIPSYTTIVGGLLILAGSFIILYRR